MNDLKSSAAPRIRMGCDIVALADVEHSIEHFGDRYLRRIYTSNELRDCAGPDHVSRLAARFAAKEAVIKALAEPSAAFGFHDVEVRRIDQVPVLVLSGAAARLAAEQGWADSAVSLSHATCHAAAAVVATCIPGRARVGSPGDERHQPETRRLASRITAELGVDRASTRGES